MYDSETYLLDHYREAGLITYIAIVNLTNLGAINLDKSITVEISPGELIDKISILEIKMERITDQDKLVNVKLEWEALNKSRSSSLTKSATLDELTAQLKAVNTTLWAIEDDIREFERLKNFGEEFVKLARAIYSHNDKRARIKRSINEFLGSKLIEEKSYASY